MHFKIKPIIIISILLIFLSGCSLFDISSQPTLNPSSYFNNTLGLKTHSTSVLTPTPYITATPTSIKEQIDYISLPLSSLQTSDYTTITMVGDCTFGSQRFTETNPKSFNNVVGTNYFYPLKGAFPLFSEDDLTIINFEGTLTNLDKYQSGKRYTFKGPAEYVNILTSSSVEMANLANNHSMDYNTAGYIDTQNTLKNANVTPIPFDSIAYYTADDVKIGVLGMSFPYDAKLIKVKINQMRQEGAQIIIVCVHWGDEADYTPTSGQIQIAHDAIDAGADIIYGHHPHVLQPIEQYKGKYIFYSLGNFSFGGNLNPRDKDTVVIQANFARDDNNIIQLCEVRIYPFRVSGMDNRNDYRPIPAKKAQQEAILKKLGLID